MQKSLDEISEEIRKLGLKYFDASDVEKFISKFRELASHTQLLDYLLQISTDEGKELEIGFFSQSSITDITLSMGKIYSYSYPLSALRNIAIIDSGAKWTLAIHGEKKFDYNVVKPTSIEALERYEKSLRAYLEGIMSLMKTI